METLSPIPSPPGHRWREFRIKVMPAIVFLVVLAAVAVTWKHYLAAPNVVGEVESLSVNVVSTAPGLLAELNVAPFERVAKDQVIGRLHTTEPEQTKASLVALEMDLRVLKARMDLDKTRNAESFSRLRLELALEQLELETAQVRLTQAESEFQRIKALYDDQIVARGVALGAGAGRNEFGYDVALRDRDQLRAEVAARERAVAELAATVERLQTTQTERLDPLIEKAIAAQQNRLLLLEAPVTLKAPAEGVISSIYHRPGERVMAGDPVVTISPVQSDRIVGYVRQPLKIIPKVGDRVQVRTRGVTRQVGVAEVLHVGSQMQPVTAPLRIRGYDNSMDRGLPFLVSVPAGMDVYPGELVDLTIQR